MIFLVSLLSILVRHPWNLKEILILLLIGLKNLLKWNRSNLGSDYKDAVTRHMTFCKLRSNFVEEKDRSFHTLSKCRRQVLHLPAWDDMTQKKHFYWLKFQNATTRIIKKIPHSSARIVGKTRLHFLKCLSVTRQHSPWCCMPVRCSKKLKRKLLLSDNLRINDWFM